MDSRRFDTLTRALGGLERRQVLALLPAAAVLAETKAEAADKKTRRKRERKRLKRFARRHRQDQVCPTFRPNQILLCTQDRSCCDLDRSNTAGCAAPDATTCCLTANQFSYYELPSSYFCCPTPSLGSLGACRDNDFPVCCPGTCCPSGADCSDLSNCYEVASESALVSQVTPN